MYSGCFISTYEDNSIIHPLPLISHCHKKFMLIAIISEKHKYFLASCMVDLVFFLTQGRGANHD